MVFLVHTEDKSHYFVMEVCSVVSEGAVGSFPGCTTSCGGTLTTGGFGLTTAGGHAAGHATCRKQRSQISLKKAKKTTMMSVCPLYCC